MRFFGLPITGVAQTVNEGNLSVRPGTEVSTYFDFHNRESGRVLNDGHFYFYDDYNNEGLFGYTLDTSTGYVIFEGKQAGVQQISGSAPSDFSNVLFNKTGDEYSFNLTNEILVGNMVDFYEGIVDNRNFGGEITFRDQANHINTSDYSHVDGQVNKLGNTEFVHLLVLSIPSYL